MRTEGISFFQDIDANLFTDDDGEKEMDEEGVKFSWKKEGG